MCGLYQRAVLSSQVLLACWPRRRWGWLSTAALSHPERDGSVLIKNRAVAREWEREGGRVLNRHRDACHAGPKPGPRLEAWWKRTLGPSRACIPVDFAILSYVCGPLGLLVATSRPTPLDPSSVLFSIPGNGKGTYSRSPTLGDLPSLNGPELHRNRQFDPPHLGCGSCGDSVLTA